MKKNFKDFYWLPQIHKPPHKKSCHVQEASNYRKWCVISCYTNLILHIHTADEEEEDYIPKKGRKSAEYYKGEVSRLKTAMKLKDNDLKELESLRAEKRRLDLAGEEERKMLEEEKKEKVVMDILKESFSTDLITCSACLEILDPEHYALGCITTHRICTNCWKKNGSLQCPTCRMEHLNPSRDAFSIAAVSLFGRAAPCGKIVSGLKLGDHQKQCITCACHLLEEKEMELKALGNSMTALLKEKETLDTSLTYAHEDNYTLRVKCSNLRSQIVQLERALKSKEEEEVVL